MNPYQFQFSNQVVFITGGTVGIGEATSMAFAACGAQVFALGTNPEHGAHIVEKAKSQFGRDTVHFFQTDVSKRADVERAVAACLEKFGKIDILINNAGITRDGLLLRMSDADFDSVLDVNLKGCFYTCQTILRPMLKAKSGKIINISSIVGLTGNPGQTNYAASKAGVIGFSKSLAKEVASRSITVNVIAPGFIDTKMTHFLEGEKREKLLEQIPLKRMGKPEEVAHSALFLASPYADYITGHVLVIDGGLAM